MAAVRQLSLTNVRRPSLALVALGANLAVTLFLASILNIWQDEAYTLQTTSRDLAYAFHQAIGFEQNAPLYFLFLTAWRHLGDGVFFLRLPSVVFIAATIALVPGIARRYLPSVDPGIVTLVTAWNPFVIWAAVEMRVYALIVLLSALLLLTFFDAFLADRPARTSAVAYALCVAVALYTQYYLAFLVAAQALTLLIYRPRALLRFALCGAAAAVAFVPPMLAVIPMQVQNFKSAFTPPTLVGSGIVLAGILARYAVPLIVPHAKIAYLALAVFGAVATIVARKRLTASGNGPILVTTAGAFVAFCVGTYATGVHVLDRHAASLYAPCILSAFAALTFIGPPLRRRATLAWTGLVLVASSVAILQTYAALAKPGDWIRATSYIGAREHPNEPVVMFEAENALPFAYYYHGPNEVRAIPHAVDFRRYDVTRFVIHGPAEIESVMPRERRVWLVTAGECTSANVVFGCGTLERFVARRYHVESDASFYGSRVRLLDRNRS